MRGRCAFADHSFYRAAVPSSSHNIFLGNLEYYIYYENTTLVVVGRSVPPRSSSSSSRAFSPFGITFNVARLSEAARPSKAAKAQYSMQGGKIYIYIYIIGI